MKRLNTKIVLLYLFSFPLKCTNTNFLVGGQCEVKCYTPRNTHIAYKIHTKEFECLLDRIEYRICRVVDLYFDNSVSCTVKIPNWIKGDINEKCFCNAIKKGFEVNIDGKPEKNERQGLFFDFCKKSVTLWEIMSLDALPKVKIYTAKMRQIAPEEDEANTIYFSAKCDVIKS